MKRVWEDTKSRGRTSPLQQPKFRSLNGFCLLLLLMTGMVFGQSSMLIPDATFLYSQKEDRVGYWLNRAGDMNGDGWDDWIIGSCHADRNGYESGAAFLLLGRAEPDWGSGFYLDNADGIFVGDLNDYVGYAIGGGGDINGDGYDDVVIGSGGRVDSNPNHTGGVFIVFGKPSPVWVGDSRLRIMADVVIQGENPVDLAGIGVEIIGDLNQDGYDEFLVGAPGNDDGADGGGKVYLFLGRANWNRYMSVTSANATFVNTSANYSAGYCVDGLGDVNGDQIPDFIIGAPGGNGKAFVLFGRSNPNWGTAFNLNNADVVFNGERGGDGAGSAVAGAGDVNGDGLDDILISAPGNDEGGAGSGKVYLKFGQRTGWDSSIYIRDVDASFIGQAYEDHLGMTQGVSGGGDFNGDGYNDILMGAQANDEAGERRGKAYLVLGKASGWTRSINLATADYAFTGAHQDTVTGMATNFVGDINHDGLQDIAISAPLYSGVQEWAGRVYLFFSENEMLRVSGNVTYADGQSPLANVTVTAACPSQNPAVTNAEGNYQIVLPREATCILTPEMNGNLNLRGSVITSYDAALTARHAVGIAPLSSFGQTLGDVNQDGAISMIDAIQICRFSAGMPNLTNSEVGTWAFSPENRSLNGLDSDLFGQDFVAHVLGNVDNVWPGSIPLAKNTHSGIGSAQRSQNQLIYRIPYTIDVDLIAADIEIVYNQRELLFNELRQTNLLDGFVVLSDSRETDKVRIGLFGTEPAKGKGDILQLVFEITSGTGSPEVGIRIQNYRFNQGLDYQAMETTRIPSTIQKPSGFRLEQNYPNPFNGETVIEYVLDRGCEAVLSITNTLGHPVKILQHGVIPAGRHRVVWRGRDERGGEVAGGVYLVRLTAGDQVVISKLVKMD